MKFYSTNNKEYKISFREAAMQGLAKDKGLFMPEYIPDCKKDIEGIETLSMQDIAFIIANKFMNDDFQSSDIEDIINKSIKFSAPLVTLEKNRHILELFHGPTLAFKDFGASFMASTIEKFVKDKDRELNILVATSGDTGSAVANGFYGAEGINVIILYPSNKISNIQEQQIATFDKNIYSLEVQGTFDDCQNLVKTAFLDHDINSHISLSSANSINIARLIPQSFYYFHGYAQLKNKESVVYSVPSGNFGNLTAGILSKFMGLPIMKFIASTNSNDTVPNFLLSGNYKPKPSIETISNAMDVGNPSNIRRIIDLYGNVDLLRKDLSSWSFTDRETKKQIKNTFIKNNYILDPHSSVGLLGLNEFLNNQDKDIQGVFLGTAHPAKFSDIIEPIIKKEIKIPTRLKKLMGKEKKSIKIKNDYNEFSDYLLTNFR